MMSERKRKRGRPRVTPVLSYEAEMKMRNNIPRVIKKPKYLRDTEEESNASRGSTPPRVFDDSSSQAPSKNSRGYHPEYDDKNSEFHYGSDFEIEGTSDNEAQDSDEGDHPSLSDGGLLSDEEGVLSDDSHEGHDQNSAPALSRPCTPEALWLQDRVLPKLVLPPSADDLLVPLEFVMPALSVYEILRHFRSIVRLSPFRFEEFCGALLSPQQTVLLADIHIALLRAMVREDESQSTHFGPLDQKDSINVMLYLVDPVTWPQVLHSYLSSDSSGHRDLVHMMDKCSYPYTSLQNRLTVLRVLTDEVLSVSGVRELLINEGKMRYDDHCRSCHKTGDLLCCDSCCAVYHLHCLGAGEAPAMPTDDWTCSVCTQNQVTGVTDCLTSPEASGLLSRHHPLGYDRHGRKYWFLARRLIVESSDGTVSYYSTTRQVQAVISRLDPIEFEAELVLNIEDQRHEMERQLAVTEKLTRSSSGGRATALAQDDETICKFVSSGSCDVKNEVKDEVKEEVNKSQDGSETLKTLEVSKLEVKDEKVKEEPCDQDQKAKLWDHSIVGRSWRLAPPAAERVTAAKLVQLRSAGQAYRLGADCGQNYVNQYSSNPLALNKLQHNEDRDKKRQLSHKFSITSPEFKWNSTTYGGASEARECVRGSIQQLEQQISPHLYHPHWGALRKAWLASLSTDSSPRQFARSLVTLVAAIKPVVFHSVWHDALGHLRLYRLTALEREERRRQEKRDRKELESQALDDLRNTLPVRFTKFPKHQLWKVRGEEYRASVGDGWRWCSRHRRVRPTPASTRGLIGGPDKVVVPVRMEAGLRGLPVTPHVFETLAQKSPQLRPCLLSPQQRAQLGEGDHGGREKNEIIISNSGGGVSKQKVEVIETRLEDHFEDGLVNVSRALVARMRLVYPKMPHPSPLLDSLLSRRLSMPSQSAAGKTSSEDGGSAEGERADNGVGSSCTADGVGSATADSAVAAPTIQEIPDSQRSATHRLRPAGHLLKEIRQHKLRYEALDENMGNYRCYYSKCTTSPGTCYSPLCRSKAKYRDKLINSVKNYTIVTSKPSPFTQVGVHDVIKLSEMDFSEAAAAAETKKKINNNSISSSLGGFFAATSSSVNCKTADGDASAAAKPSDSTTKSSSEISVRLEADLDESSQESDTLEQKFGLNGAKEGDVSDAPTCSGKVYLRKAPSSSTAAKAKSAHKLPPLSSCCVGKDRHSVLVLPAWELKVLCRRWWRHNVSGFGHQAKSNPSVWPYQCPRPLFKQTWLYHTATLTSLSAVALQLRILWCCLRWDDMQEKGLSDGKRHITTDTEIVQTEVLKRKYSGRFSEKTEYLRRKVTIPLDVPKPVREFTPSQRSGLRKRRRAQSPEDKRPESLEEWVPEEQLLLWEIRLFGERLERAANLPKKTDSATSLSSSKITLSTSAGSSFELKQRMEEQLKQQRSVFQQQQREAGGAGTARTLLKISSITSSADANKPSLLTPIKAAPVGGTSLSAITPAKKLMRTKDGRIISVQRLGNMQPGSAGTNFTPTVLPKVHIASSQQTPPSGVGNNKVIRLQTVPTNPRMILPRTPRPPTIVQATPPAPPPATVRLPNQNIQIIRLPDGNIQVKGLLEGQQIIQRADGKFQLINSKTSLATSSVAPTPVVQVTQQPKPTVVLSNSHQLVKLNGQQVLLRKEGVGAQVVSVGAGDAVKTTTGGVFVNQQKPAVISSNVGQLKVAADGAFVTAATAPPASAVPVSTATQKPETNSLTLKVQVRMTQQGPKTIIQGLLPTVGLTKDHIRAIQQQVRAMLAQYNLKVDQLSPIMTLTLQMNNSSAQATSVAQPAAAPNPVPQQPQPAVVKQVPSPAVRVSGPSPVKVPAVIALKNNTTSTFIRTSSGSIIPAPAVSSASLESKPTPSSGTAGTTAPSNGAGQFVLTSDYIQETIQSALSRNDLPPDVEEKLMQLKKYNSEQTPDNQQQQQQQVGSATPGTPAPPGGGKRARDTSEAGAADSNNKRGRGNKRARVSDAGRGNSAAHAPRRPMDTSSTTGEDGSSPSSKKRRSGGSAAASPADDARRKATTMAKLESQLSRHKDLLKKDILKKRAFLEKDLQLQIHRELNVAKQQLETLEKKAPLGASKGADSAPKKKRKLASNTDVSWSSASASNTDTVSSTTAASPPSHNTKKHKTSNNKKLKNKNKKIVCICRTPFDDTKFYVGCDLCANWYHGDCVGITEALSRTMNEYVCDDCANAKMNKELYCFCRQPYDETQFYICCEQCEDWYHGRCIGIMQGEADDIDDYICPKCQPNNVWNQPCQKKLTNKDYTELKKLAKTLVSHKNAWPFLDAVDPSQVPDYYKVVRQPMDLRTVERRVKDHHYNRLADFVGDIMLLLDNCRLYNPPNSSFVSCAATLESFCCSKLKLFKQKMTSQSPHH